MKRAREEELRSNLAAAEELLKARRAAHTKALVGLFSYDCRPLFL